MKYRYSILLTLILNLITNQLIGQEKRYSIQFDYGISRTLHFSQPVNFYYCFDGCFAEEQEPRLASNIGFSLYYAISQSNNLKIGIGSSEYKFSEKGSSSPGSGFYAYEINREFRYTNIFIGFRHIFNNKDRKINPLIESDLIYERLRKEDMSYGQLKNFGIAVKLRGGMNFIVTHNLSFVLTGFFKSGIMNYNIPDIEINPDFHTVYIPFGYGVELGLNLILDKL